MNLLGLLLPGPVTVTPSPMQQTLAEIRALPVTTAMQRQENTDG